MFGGIWNKSHCPIGLDIGAHSVKMLQLERRSGGVGVIAAATQPLPADLPADGPAREAALAGLVKQLYASGGFSGRRVVSCLPANIVQYKNLRLPKMPADELKAAVAWEAADRLRLSQDMALDFYDAGEVRQGEETRQEVILLAANRVAVDEHMRVLIAAGLQPVAIDAVPGALARAFISAESPEPDAPASVILDMGYSSTKVLIARHGRVMFFKLIEVGGKKLDETVAQHLSLPLADAVELRRRLQQQQPTEQAEASTEASGSQPLFGTTRRDTVERAVFESLRSTVGEMAREVGLCLRYYSVTFRGRRPDAMQLVGGEAYEPQMAKLLTEGAGVAVTQALPLKGFALGRSVSVLGADRPHSEWAVAAGLSLRVESRAAMRGAA